MAMHQTALPFVQRALLPFSQPGILMLLAIAAHLGVGSHEPVHNQQTLHERKGKEKSMLVGVGCGRPWIDQ